MAKTYGECKKFIQEITDRLSANRSRLVQAAQLPATVKADLDSIPVSLKPFFDDIAALGSGTATDVMKDETQILLTELSDLSLRADAMVKAVSALE